MQIGTPYTTDSTRVMLLGCGELGKEVIIALQRLGCEVIAVDRYEHAPGHQVAHRAHVIDMTDGQALRRLIELERPALVVPEIEAIATDMLAEIESEGLAKIIPTARATQLTMNREGIRRLSAEELSLPTSKYGFADTFDEVRAIIADHIPLPVIIKPVMSSSGKGQSLVSSMDELEKAWDYAQTGGRVGGGRVIVEEKIEFDFEITLLTVRALNTEGQIETHFCAPIGHLQQDGDYIESWQPQPMTETALTMARDVASKVTASLGGQGLFGVELFIKGDEVYFSEVSPRPHDTGLVTMVTQRQSEFELHARAILGLPVNTALLSPGASAVIYGGMDEKGIAYADIDKALAVEGTELRLFGKPYSYIHRRMGVAVAHAENIESARENAKEAASRVQPISMQTN